MDNKKKIVGTYLITSNFFLLIFFCFSLLARSDVGSILNVGVIFVSFVRQVNTPHFNLSKRWYIKTVWYNNS